jgi:hypothetical protein
MPIPRYRIVTVESKKNIHYLWNECVASWVYLFRNWKKQSLRCFEHKILIVAKQRVNSD